MSVGNAQLGVSGTLPLAIPEPTDWGTGKPFSVPRLPYEAPSWHNTGQPVTQYYQLTELKRSNLRPDDQLLPKPQSCVMHPLLNREYFPTEHPYSSHIPRKAIFPNFDCPEDPTRNYTRQPLAKQHLMPASPHPIIVASKAKDGDCRREIMDVKAESLKEPLHWPENFDQLPKSPTTAHATLYPTPPKVYVPNLEQRDDHKTLHGNMALSERTANVTRNIERLSHMTTQQLTHTGMGTSFPLALDNLDEQRARFCRGQEENTALRTRGNALFLPARPQDGRWSRLTALRQQQQQTFEESLVASSSTNCQPRKMTRSEFEEYRLLNGNPFTSLPPEIGNSETNSSAKQNINNAQLDESLTERQCVHTKINNQTNNKYEERSFSTATDLLSVREPSRNINYDIKPIYINKTVSKPLHTSSSAPALYQRQGSDDVQLSVIYDDIAKKKYEINYDIMRTNSAPSSTFPFCDNKPHTAVLPRLSLTASEPKDQLTPMRVQMKNYFATVPLTSETVAQNCKEENIVISPDSAECPLWNLGYKDHLWPKWWYPGCGEPRPATALADIQNSFSKTEARRRFDRFSENSPDLRDNIIAGRKHNFGSFNAQILRGNGGIIYAQ